MSKRTIVDHLNRRLWVLIGVLDKGFDIAVLEPIAALYKKIGSVPANYYQTQLF